MSDSVGYQLLPPTDLEEYCMIALWLLCLPLVVSGKNCIPSSSSSSVHLGVVFAGVCKAHGRPQTLAASLFTPAPQNLYASEPVTAAQRQSDEPEKRFPEKRRRARICRLLLSSLISVCGEFGRSCWRPDPGTSSLLCHFHGCQTWMKRAPGTWRDEAGRTYHGSGRFMVPR